MCYATALHGADSRRHQHWRDDHRRPLRLVAEIVFVMRVPGFKSAEESGDDGRDRHLFLEAAFAHVLRPTDGFMFAGHDVSPSGADARAGARVLPVPFTATKKRSHKTEVRADTEQQRGKYGRPHHHVDNGKSPAAGFPVNASNMEIEAHYASPSVRIEMTGRTVRAARLLKKPAKPPAAKRDAEDHGGVHDTAAVTASVMLVSDFEAGQHARHSGDQRQPALKAAFANVQIGLAATCSSFAESSREFRWPARLAGYRLVSSR